MTLRIVSVSSGRADVGVLTPVWRALQDIGVDLHIIATGMHRAPTAPPLQVDGLNASIHCIGQDLGGHADSVAVDAMADITAACGRLYEELQPQLVLLIGDRLDMLPAAVAALPLNIPIAHLHGGEITEGAIDDRIRHALTQLSHLHLASCKSAAARIAQMRSSPANIHVTGAPGLDTLLAAPLLARDVFLRETGLNAVEGAQAGFWLATVHPETEADDALQPAHALMAALDQLRGPVLFTAPNSDPGGAQLRAQLEQWVSGRTFALLLDTLGSRLYPNALRHAQLMVGNSSSGIVEAGLFGLPVVDVGDRQKGRERGANVASTSADKAKIRDALAQASSMGRFANQTPYGTGNAAPKIAAAIADFTRLK